MPHSCLVDYEVGAITIAPSSNFLVSSALLSSPKICYDVPIAFDLVQGPQSFLEATTHPGWQATMQSIYDNHIWELVPWPPWRIPIMTKWVYKVKKDQVGNITQLKALRGQSRKFEFYSHPNFHSRTKHVDAWHHFIREKVELGQVTLHYVSTRDRLADILIEPLGIDTFERLRAQLGLEWITECIYS